MEDSRYVTMCLPRVLARQAYGYSHTEVAAKNFSFQEFQLDKDGIPVQTNKDHYCWMSAAFALAGCMSEATFNHGWAVAIRGVESGGKVDNLPLHLVKGDGAGKKLQCPTEVSLTMSKDSILAKAGFMPLIFEQNTNHAAFIGAQTVNKPKQYTDDAAGKRASASANLSARLPYMMAVSKAAHVMQKMLRYQLGKSKEADEIESYLQTWFINNFVTESKNEEAKASKPFAKAEISVTADEANPGVYNVSCNLRPHYQVEEVNVGMSLVARSKDGNG
jgi:type VI secretion system protein ImpC